MSRNDVASLATEILGQGMESAWSSAEADTGDGALGKWPPQGDHQCIVTGVTVKKAEFFQSDAEGGKLDAISIQFHYQLFEDPNNDEPMKWNGRPLIIPNTSKLRADNRKKQVEISLGRVKAAVEMILEREASNNLVADLQAVADALAEDKAVVCTIRINERSYKDKRTGEAKESRDDFFHNRVS